MVFDYDLASCGGLAVLIIWTLSTSGPSDDDGSPGKLISQQCRLYFLAFCLILNQFLGVSIPRALMRVSISTFKEKPGPAFGTWNIMAQSCPAAHWPSLWHPHHLPDRKGVLLRCALKGFSLLEKAQEFSTFSINRSLLGWSFYYYSLQDLSIQ